MKVYERLAQAFLAEGGAPVFGLLGDQNAHFVDCLDKLGIETLQVRHEGAGLAMADGWARVSGGVGVCATVAGPGTAQLSTTMIVASRARTPVVNFAGNVNVGDEEHHQYYDLRKFADAMEAGYVRLTSPDSTDEVVRKAFYKARLESRPVVLDAPWDTQLRTFEDDDEPYEPSTRILPSQTIAPNPDRLSEAAEIVASSKRPVIIVGRGAMASGAGEAVLKLGDRIGALIATTLMAKNWLRESEPEWSVGISGLYATRAAMELFQDADCVIAVGASLNFHTTEHGYLYPNARYVHLDVRPHVLTSGVKSADCYVQTDGRLGVEALEALLAEQGLSNAGYRTAETKQLLAESFVDSYPYEIAEGTVDPREACLAVDDGLPPELNLILGGGHGVQMATMLMNRARVMTLCNQHFGCIGQGLTTAMGAVLATDRRPSCLVEGDAGLMMHIAEFDTAVRYNLPLLVVVLNDLGLGADLHRMRTGGLNTDLARIPTPDLGAVGRVFGGRGALARTVDEVRAATAEFVANPGPTILDVRVDPNVLSLPYRRAIQAKDQ